MTDDKPKVSRDQYAEFTFRKYGLELDQAALDRLGAALERINEAERRSWRNIERGEWNA